MGLLKKIAKPFKKAVKKFVPKELAGIMQVAAPFTGAAAPFVYAAGAYKQSGKINPIALASMALPYVGYKPGEGLGGLRYGNFNPVRNNMGALVTEGKYGVLGEDIKTARDFLGLRNAEGLRGKAEDFLFGGYGIDDEGRDIVKRGILGDAGKFNPREGFLVKKQGSNKLNFTNIGAAAAAGLSLTQTQQQIEEEADEAGLSSGEIARLQAEAEEMWKDFDTTAFKPNVAKGGLMRVNRREGNPDPQRPAQKRGVGSLMPGVMESLDISSFFKDMSSSPDFKMPEGSSERDDLREVMLFGDNDMGKAKQIIDEENLEMLYKKAAEIVKENDEANDYFLKLINSDEFKEGNFSSADAYYSVIKKFGNERVNRREGNPLPPDPTKPIGVPPGFKPKPIGPVLPSKAEAVDVDILRQMFMEALKNGEIPPGTDFDTYKDMMMTLMSKTQAKKGGLMRANYALGSMPTKEESGLGGLPIEADMRYTGGFMPYGAKEKADDVPARLSKNEFVFTADAVRAAGGGSVQKGAQRMYNTMKQLESMGKMA